MKNINLGFNYIPALFFGVLILLNGCKKDENNENATVPVLTTSEVSYFTNILAVAGGNISNDGGAAVTVRGVCWSSLHLPAISDSNTADGSGTGSFASIMKGLNPGTTYSVRAYATNSIGTAYGNEVKFTTTKSSIPVLTTTAVTQVTTNSAISGGNISCDGGSPVTLRGVCWSLNSEPTTADYKTSDGSGSGLYKSIITGLNPNTTYYARAYATNIAGTSYGSTFSLTTLPVNGGTVTDIDGNLYHTLTIGTQIWMVENLKVTHYRNGDVIPNVTDSVEWYKIYTYLGAQCDYNNQPFNALVYGKLYNFYAVTDTRKICPSGWHVPSDDEWTTLADFLGSDTFAGGKLKETGTAHWQSPNAGATNETGFTGLPGGIRTNEGSFGDIGKFCYFWTSTPIYNYAWFRYLDYRYPRLGRTTISRQYGFSVRCIKD